MAGFLLVSANTAAAAYFLNRVYPGVKVAGVSLGRLDRAEAESRLGRQLSGYQLDLTVDGQHYQAKPEQLGANYNLDATYEAAFAVGRNLPFPVGLWSARHATPLLYAYQVDEGQLADFVNHLATAHSSAAVDAVVTVVNGKVSVTPDQNGVGVNKQHLTLSLEEALADQQGQLSLPRESIPADIKAADTTTTVSAAQKLMATQIELTYNDKTFVPSAAIIGSWLVFTKSGDQLTVTVDPAKVGGYVNGLGNSGINVDPKNHLINTVNGQVSGEEQGVEGTAIDTDSLVNQIVPAVNGGQTKIAITTHSVPFKTVYNNTINLDFGRYIEINLSMQHLWVYQDHQVVFDSPITSGATGAGFPTVQGLFSVEAKQTDRNLNGYAIGYNYNVYVQYWMPFYKDYGMHDASWRSSFGGQDYYYGGSHGCVNMPLESAAWIYNWADVGTPVWIHG